MIWYLLYPLRGTTEAPVLDPSHPVRNGFARYGRYAARHAVTTLLVSAAVATSLIYPIPFLFTTDFTNGASNLPHHVWTDAKPLAYNSPVEPDVIMRSVWVHGSYMKALDSHLLASALELQDELLGPTEDFSPRQTSLTAPDYAVASLSPSQRDAVHVINGLTNASWFFHSPLLYWGCSRDRILADEDIVSTVNDKKNQSTSVNVTLRHSIVFSGKRFEERRLMAADALVITLLHLGESPVGRQWEARATDLASKANDKWDIYPSDGRISSSQLFEFQFRPMSVQDSVILALAYGLTLLYFLISLSKLRAFKSKVGLMVTVMCQSALSVMSSFTICAIFNIDLSRIPQAAYPLAILSMSLENIFRLINAVIVHSSDENTSNRIGHAFGETAHIALVSTLQNALILSGLSRVVSPGVAAFCVFATVAIVLDYFFLSTFFLSVLSVDVRRTELSDALAKASAKAHGRKLSDTRNRSTWLEQVLQGKIAMSTRIAGTIVMVGFVLIAQWHFFDDQNMLGLLFRSSRDSKATQGSGTTRGALLKDIHQARSMTSWLRLQDHETAREVINIIKPSSYSYIARVYEPLVFVLKNSDRTPPAKEPSLLPAAYDFIHHQLTRFVVIIIVVVAALRLLTSYLLWEDEASAEDQHDLESPLLSVRSLSGGHALDVAMLASSTEGHVISVGLDRLIRVWDVRSGGPSYVIADANKAGEHLIPVMALAIDETARWLAILSSFHVTFWNLMERSPGPSVPVDNCGQKLEAFFFVPDTASRSPKLALVRRNGTLTEFRVASGESEEFILCSSPLISAQPLLIRDKGHPPSRAMVVAASRKGLVHVGTRGDSTWVSRALHFEELEGREVQHLVVLSSLRLFLVASTDRVYLASVDEPAVIHIFRTETMQPRSLECAYVSHRSSQPNAAGLTAFTLCYTAAETGDCLSQSYNPTDDKDGISLQRDIGLGMSNGWCSWQAAKEVKKRFENPGAWEMLPDGNIVGIRRRLPPNEIAQGLAGDASGRIRRRLPVPNKCKTRLGCWEIWTASGAGRSGMDECRPLFREEDQAGHLIISELGPRVRVGRTSVGVGFGNMIKLVTLGHERFEWDSGETSREPMMNVGSRRRKPSAMARVRIPSAWPGQPCI